MLKETKGINPNAKQRYAWENGVKTVSKVVNINKPKIIKVFLKKKNLKNESSQSSPKKTWTNRIKLGHKPLKFISIFLKSQTPIPQ